MDPSELLRRDVAFVPIPNVDLAIQRRAPRRICAQRQQFLCRNLESNIDRVQRLVPFAKIRSAVLCLRGCDKLSLRQLGRRRKHLYLPRLTEIHLCFGMRMRGSRMVTRHPLPQPNTISIPGCCNDPLEARCFGPIISATVRSSSLAHRKGGRHQTAQTAIDRCTIAPQVLFFADTQPLLFDND
jgi:hypothetical protein